MKYFIYQIITRDEDNNWVADYRFYHGKKFADEFDMQPILGRREEAVFLGRLNMNEFRTLKYAMLREKNIAVDKALLDEAKQRDAEALELYNVKPKTPLLKGNRLKAFERDNYTCVSCGATDVELTTDHLIPKAKGGSNKIWNLAPMCQPCNTKKADLLIDYYVQMAKDNQKKVKKEVTKKPPPPPPKFTTPIPEEILSKETPNFHEL